MTTQTIIILVAIVAVIALLALRGAGPRVTHIETRHEKDEGDDA